MAQMVRKQIYIQQRQQILLRRIAQNREVSEAAIIRQAIDRVLTSPRLHPIVPDPTAWDEILRFVEEHKTLSPAREPYQWNREDAYKDRMSLFDRSEN